MVIYRVFKRSATLKLHYQSEETKGSSEEAVELFCFLTNNITNQRCFDTHLDLKVLGAVDPN